MSPLFLGKATDALLRGELPVGEIIVYVGLRFMVSLFEEGQRLVYLRVKQVRTSCLLSNATASIAKSATQRGVCSCMRARHSVCVRARNHRCVLPSSAAGRLP